MKWKQLQRLVYSENRKKEKNTCTLSTFFVPIPPFFARPLVWCIQMKKTRKKEDPTGGFRRHYLTNAEETFPLPSP